MIMPIGIRNLGLNSVPPPYYTIRVLPSRTPAMKLSGPRLLQVSLLISLALAANALPAETPTPPRNPFFAYCVGVGVEPSMATLPAHLATCPDAGRPGL